MTLPHRLWVLGLVVAALVQSCAAPVLDAELPVMAQPALAAPTVAGVAAVAAAGVQPTARLRPTASAAPTALVASVPVAVVTAASLNGRAYPGTDYAVLFALRRNDVLYIAGAAAGADNAWLPIYAVDKGYGWVAQRLQSGAAGLWAALPQLHQPPPQPP